MGNNEAKTEWVRGIALPQDLVERVDKYVAKNKYPKGQYRSRNHFIVEAVKNVLKNVMA